MTLVVNWHMAYIAVLEGSRSCASRLLPKAEKTGTLSAPEICVERLKNFMVGGNWLTHRTTTQALRSAATIVRVCPEMAKMFCG